MGGRAKLVWSRKWRYLFLVATCLSPIAPAIAASFDCTKAKTQVERSICSDKEISWLDVEMDDVFSVETQRGNRAEALRSSQRNWIAKRNLCKDAACLIHQYEDRIAELACDKNGYLSGSAIGSNQCASFQLRILERQLTPLLDARSRQVLEASNNIEHSKTVLAEEDRAWRAYRDAQCALHGAIEGGSDGWKNAFAGHCSVDETRKRIESLKPARNLK